MRIKYASDMRMQCAFRIRRGCAYLNAFWIRIRCTSKILSFDPNLAISRYAFQMHFRCASKMLKRFDAKLKRFKCVSCSLGNRCAYFAGALFNYSSLFLTIFNHLFLYLNISSYVKCFD